MVFSPLETHLSEKRFAIGDYMRFDYPNMMVYKPSFPAELESGVKALEGESCKDNPSKDFEIIVDLVCKHREVEISKEIPTHDIRFVENGRHSLTTL